MEIKENIKINNSFKHKIITYFGLFLVGLLILYIIYITEKYIFYSSIYLLLYFISKILKLYNLKINYYIKLISGILSFYVQLIIFRIIILSVVFMGGGLGKKIIVYNQFKNFIVKYIHYIEHILNLIFTLTFDSESLISLDTKMQNIYKLKNVLSNQKNTFEIKEHKIFDTINEIINYYNAFKEKNYKNDDIKIKITTNLNKLQTYFRYYLSFSFIDTFIKFKCKETLLFLNKLLFYSFEDRKVDEIKINNFLSFYIVRPKNGYENTNNLLVLLCNQNAIFAESYSISQENIKYYLSIPYSTLILWSYPGFGLRNEFPTFKGIQKDVNLIINYIIKEFYDYKIIIHGISIGGFSCIKFAKEILDSKIIDKNNICLIADRTYCDVDKIVERLSNKFCNSLKFLYSFIFPKFIYKSDNIFDYINLPVMNKFIFFDEKDEIISYYQSSLIYGITLFYYKNFLYKKIKNLKEYEAILKIIKDKHLLLEIKKIYNNNCIIIHDNENLSITFFKNIYLHLSNFNQKNSKEYNFTNFLMYFLSFCFPFNKYKEIQYTTEFFTECYLGLPYKMQEIAKNSNLSVNLISFISKLNYIFIKTNLISTVSNENIISFKYNDIKNDFSLKEEIKENILQHFGYVHRIFCGHNGTLRNSDNDYLLFFLEEKKFIKKMKEDNLFINFNKKNKDVKIDEEDIKLNVKNEN